MLKTLRKFTDNPKINTNPVSPTWSCCYGSPPDQSMHRCCCRMALQTKDQTQHTLCLHKEVSHTPNEKKELLSFHRNLVSVDKTESEDHLTSQKLYKQILGLSIIDGQQLYMEGNKRPFILNVSPFLFINTQHMVCLSQLVLNERWGTHWKTHESITGPHRDE